MGTAKQNELIATLIEQFQSLPHEFRSFRNSTDQNINNIKEFTKTSDRNRAKEIVVLQKPWNRPATDEHPFKNQQMTKLTDHTLYTDHELVTSQLDQETASAKNKASNQERSHVLLRHYGVETM